MRLMRITAPHFVAGVDVKAHRAAPILHYMGRWGEARIRAYCASKRWAVEDVD